MKAYNIKVRLSKQEDGLWRAEVPALAGCFVDGPTIKEVLRDIQECAAMALDLRLEVGQIPTNLEAVNVENMEFQLPVVIEEHKFRRIASKNKLDGSNQSQPRHKARV